MEVYIVFTDTKTSMAKIIKSYTRYPFSHVSLSFSKDLTQMYSFGRKQAGNALTTGFVKEDIRDSLFQQADCAVCKLELSEDSYFKVLGYVQKMEREQEGFKFNFSGLLAVVMRYPSKRKDAYFCSQFVAEALEAGGIRIADKPPALVTPRDLFATGTTLIHRGVVHSYPYLQGEQTEEMLEAIK